jgi:hypothetical protein
MYNLYSMTKMQVAIRQLFAITRDNAGNLPPLPDGSLRIVARGVKKDAAGLDE